MLGAGKITEDNIQNLPFGLRMQGKGYKSLQFGKLHAQRENCTATHSLLHTRSFHCLNLTPGPRTFQRTIFCIPKSHELLEVGTGLSPNRNQRKGFLPENLLPDGHFEQKEKKKMLNSVLL